MSSRVILPCRSIVGVSPERSTTVDAVVPLASPPSITRSTRCPSCSFTACAVVSDGLPLKLALVPVMALSRDFEMYCGSQWSGTRSPTVSRPAVSLSETRGLFRMTIVKGPGQNALASAQNDSGTSETYRSTELASSRSNGKASPEGLLLMRKTRSTASSSS